MATSNTIPVVIPQPIAAQATSENINVIPNGATGTNRASFQEGFPAITRMPVIKNPLPTQVSGLPPKQQDFNGLFNVVSQHNFFAQNGGTYSFNQAVSDAIGGYPKNAVLWYFPENEDPCLVYSLINDNTNNFVDDPTLIDGIHWEALVNPSSYANLALTNSPYTTNRILEIPQDIKLELNNGTLTLKAGSKVYVPNGFESDGVTKKFDVIILNNDQTISTGFNGMNVALFYGGHGRMSLDRIFSGDTMPSTTTNDDVWYDTASNKIKTYKTASSSWIPFEVCSLPVGLATANTNGTGFTSIDQVFNGFGYIGSTVFALPGVKVQIPDGRNENGTCKSVYGTIRTVQQTSTNPGNGDFSIRIGDNLIAVSKFVYDEETNYNYNQTVSPSNIRYQTNAGTVSYLSGKITSFTPYKVDSVLNSSLSNLSAAGQAKFDAKANTDASNFTATGKQTVVGWGMPDYSAGVTITSGYTATQKGLATVSMDGTDHNTNTIYVNDVKIGFSSAENHYQEAPVNTQLSLDVGDKIRWTGTQSVIAIFFPYKGV